MLNRRDSTLKAVIMVQDNPSWSQVLPLVLLGLQTAKRGKFASSPVELVYGKNLRLPSDPVLDIKSRLNATGLLRLLKDAMPKLKPPPPANHTKAVTDVPKDLVLCTHVLIRMDAPRKPLQSHEGRGGSFARLKPFV